MQRHVSLERSNLIYKAHFILSMSKTFQTTSKKIPFDNEWDLLFIIDSF